MDTQTPIVILTGAGISAESGIATFRDQGGLWEKHRIEDVATPEAFVKNPKKVHAFYNKRREQLLTQKITPNAAHVALAKLENKWPAPVMIITQNIDNLHERAGSMNVLHMHGSLLEVRCTHTEKTFPWTLQTTSQTACPCCGDPGNLRPNIVWFGEIPFGLDESFTALETCGLFLSIGTSGQVYPAAGFAQHVQMHTKAPMAEINLEGTEISHMFHEKLYGKATDIVPSYIDRLLKDHGLS